ncbi:hypothetical protein TEA_009870 [Camellia sinensis var. sinensis]|uniref:Rx N-terminal domain-containing protein n=1 Tax=Camellia sinensis var. sinensis TaxID=542762 RepID=A0A4S4EIN1_CAMSN|nr:hypothetical protein TEA_009870 [Camellia sinensis var. sinensis]
MAMESLMAVVPYLTPKIENLESLLKNEVALLWGNRITEITDKFDAIAANRIKFHLNERLVVEKRVEYDVSRETSSFITQPQLYGRDEDRDKIVKFLVEDRISSLYREKRDIVEHRKHKVRYIENEYPGGGGFPSLEELYVYSCPKLEGLSREEGRELFPCLRKMQIRDCPKLSFLHLSSSKELFLQDKYTMVLNSISNLSSLTSLTIRHDEETVCFPKEFLRNLTLLESLSIQNCQKLKVLPQDLASLVILKSLEIEGCRNLQSLPEEGLRCLESLQSLRIYRSMPEDCIASDQYSKPYQTPTHRNCVLRS